MKNEILEELWQSKDEIAQEYKYNIDELVEAHAKKNCGCRLGQGFT